MKFLLACLLWFMAAFPAAAQTFSANTNPVAPDSATPTVAVTAPSNGATGLTGNVTVTATCSDTIAPGSIQLYVDNVQLGSSATKSPLNATWNTANYIDGAHAIFATCTNVGGVAETSSTVTASTSNGVAAKTVYLDPTSRTDCPTNNGLSSSTPCATLKGVQSVVNSLKLHGGDSILQKAGTNLNLADLTTSSVLMLCGPSSNAGNGTVRYCTAQNVYPGQTITIGTYGGSGNCNILAGVTTDCGSITLNANGSVPRNFSPLSVFNVTNVAISNLRIFGSQSNAVGCPANATTGCSEGIKIAAVGGYAVGNAYTGPTISNVEVVDFWAGIWASNSADPGLVYSGSMCNVSITQSYVHGSSVSSGESTGIYSQGNNCFSGTTPGLTVSSSYIADIGNILGGGTAGGVGILMGGASQSANQFGNYLLVNYTATTANGYNSTTCGAGYGVEFFFVKNITLKGNELWNHFPSLASFNTNPAVCDTGDYDFDNGVANGVGTFNYGHEFLGTSDRPIQCHCWPSQRGAKCRCL